MSRTVLKINMQNKYSEKNWKRKFNDKLDGSYILVRNINQKLSNIKIDYKVIKIVDI